MLQSLQTSKAGQEANCIEAQREQKRVSAMSTPRGAQPAEAAWRRQQRVFAFFREWLGSYIPRATSSWRC